MRKKDEYRTKEYLELSREMDKRIEEMKKTLDLMKTEDLIPKVEKLKRDSDIKDKIIQAMTGLEELHVDYYIKDKVVNEVYWCPKWGNYFVVKIMVEKTKQIIEKWENPLDFMKKLESNGFKHEYEWIWNERDSSETKEKS